MGLVPATTESWCGTGSASTEPFPLGSSQSGAQHQKTSAAAGSQVLVSGVCRTPTAAAVQSARLNMNTSIFEHAYIQEEFTRVQSPTAKLITLQHLSVLLSLL